MKKYFLLLACMITFGLQAQQLEFAKKGGGTGVLQNGELLNYKEVKTIMTSNMEAFNLLKKAKGNNALAQTLSGIGGAFIGFPLGQSIGGGDANWALAGIGAGLVGVAIPISSGARKKMKQAVDTYNAGLNPSVYLFNPLFQLKVGGNGMRLVMQF